MAKEILDNSGSYLRIFVEEFKVDYSLPKFDKLKEEMKDEKKVENKYSVPQNAFGDMVNNENIINSIYKESKGLLVDEKFFNELDPQDLAIIIDQKRRKNYFSDTFVEPRLVEVFTTGTNEKMEQKDNTGILRKIRKFLKGKEKKEPLFELNVLDFFNDVKSLTKEQAVTYINRISPLLIAIKEAEEMGQDALVDKYLTALFVNKYESILYSKGINMKITEEQLVGFAKKTEKGVRLDYISNYGRHIPEEVRKKKKEADEALVFDNYVILYYDKNGKVYTQTAKEQHEERMKKADPIMFGVINGLHELYYITDWTDEFCDLTLDKFLEVSGISKKSLEVGEKIKLNI